MTKSRHHTWDRFRRTGILAALVAVMAVSLAACGGDNASSSSQTPADNNSAASAVTSAPSGNSASGGAQDVKVTLTEWSITPKDVSVTSGKVTFEVSNTGKFTHDLSIMQNGQQVAVTPKFKSSDGTKTLEVDLKPGTYQMICDITGHKDKGMDGTITVK